MSESKQAGSSHFFTIGDIAARSGVGVETVRFYERKGLLEKPARSSSGYRLYAQGAVSCIRFIRRAQELGFSLREIGELLQLRVDGRTTCRDVKRKAEEKVAEVDSRIADLARIRRALNALVQACAGSGPTSECPILEALERPGRTRGEGAVPGKD